MIFLSSPRSKISGGIRMPIVKGYYNVNNETFLGLMTATNTATGVVSTPRYIDGVCFGSYNEETGEFIPETNPMRIPEGGIVTVDEDPKAFMQGRHKENVTGIEEDKGADIARKKIFTLGEIPYNKPEVKKPELVLVKNLNNVNLDNLF